MIYIHTLILARKPTRAEQLIASKVRLELVHLATESSLSELFRRTALLICSPSCMTSVVAFFDIAA